MSSFSIMDIAKALRPLLEELKSQEGHGEHFGWSTMAPSLTLDGYPEDGTIMLCGCGEILLTTREVRVLS